MDIHILHDTRICIHRQQIVDQKSERTKIMHISKMCEQRYLELI